MILEYKKYAPDEFVDNIRQRVSLFVDKTNQRTLYNRDGITVNVTKTPELNDLDAQLCQFFNCVSSDVVAQRYKPQYPAADTGYEYHLYRPGDICHYHADGEVAEGMLRYATVMLFLTDNEDGELVFPLQNTEVRPEKGKLVVFPPYGFFGHYSKPSLKNREILMTWFVYNSIEVKKRAA
jgi:hypothetical protein